MKKIILSLTAMLTIGASAVFAGGDPETNPKAIAVFKKEFVNAESVKWSQEEGYNKVTFLLGGNRAIAFFSNEGELLGSARDLVYNQLPLSVMSSMDKRFTGAAIFDIREVTNANGTHYKFTLEQKGKKYNVSVFSDGYIEDVLKIRK